MLTVGVDTYISVDEATEILGGSEEFTRWEALSTEQQENALKEAVMHIDMLTLAGTKLSAEQSLEFPRKPYLYIPQQVKLAQAYEAVEVACGEGSERIRLQSQGVTSITLGSVSESYNGKISGSGMLSTKSARLMRKYIIGSAVIV